MYKNGIFWQFIQKLKIKKTEWIDVFPRRLPIKSNRVVFFIQFNCTVACAYRLNKVYGSFIFKSKDKIILMKIFFQFFFIIISFYLFLSIFIYLYSRISYHKLLPCQVYLEIIY